jgi:hypothetical protein
MAIHENLTKTPILQLREVGWRKATELFKVARKGPETLDCATRLHKARELPKKGSDGEVDRHLTGKETESWEPIYFKLYKSQLPMVKIALDTAGLMLAERVNLTLPPRDDQRGYKLGRADGRSEHPSPTANTSLLLTFRVNGYRRNPMSVAAP